MKNQKEGIVIVALVCVIFVAIVLGFYYLKDKKAKPTEKETNPSNDTTAIIKNKNDYEGKIGDYSYTINSNCANYDDLEKLGYNIAYMKMPNSPEIFTISSGLYYITTVKQITIKDGNLEIIVDKASTDDAGTFKNGIFTTCIEIYENKTTPKFKSVVIKNSEEIYSNYNDDKDEEQTIEGTNITYKVLDNCDTKDLDLKRQGYYVDTENRPDAPYVYTIVAGQKPNGCSDIALKSISYKDNYLNIYVEEPKNRDGAICSDVITYPYLCIEVNNIGDHNVVISEQIEEDSLIEYKLIK